MVEIFNVLIMCPDHVQFNYNTDVHIVYKESFLFLLFRLLLVSDLLQSYLNLFRKIVAPAGFWLKILLKEQLLL